jgi:hypothetical protein
MLLHMHPPTPGKKVYVKKRPCQLGIDNDILQHESTLKRVYIVEQFTPAGHHDITLKMRC